MRRSRSRTSLCRKRLLADEKPIERLPPKEGELYWQVDRQGMLRAEIDGAVDAFFEGNNIAARVLAWAALDVLRSLAERQKVETFHARLEDCILEEYVLSWRRLLRSDYTYFKHADRDPDRVIDDYRPEATAYNLVGAVADYGSVFKKQTLRMATFQAWFFGRFPNLLKPEWLPSFSAAIEALPSSNHADFHRSLECARDKLREFASKREAVISQLSPEIRSKFEDLA